MEQLHDLVLAAPVDGEGYPGDGDFFDAEELERTIESVDPSYAPEATDEDDLTDTDETSMKFKSMSNPKPRELPLPWVARDPNSRNLRQELLTGKEYLGADYGKGWHAIKSTMFQVYFHSLGVDNAIKFIFTIQLSPHGTRHPHVYASQSQSDDPASRIGILIRGKLKEGDYFEQYAKEPHSARAAWKAPMVWNAIHDWLGGISWQEIALANEPRRFVKIKPEKHPPEISRFHPDGAFTDNSLTPEGERMWSKDKGFAEQRKEKREKIKEAFTDNSLTPEKKKLWSLEKGFYKRGTEKKQKRKTEDTEDEKERDMFIPMKKKKKKKKKEKEMNSFTD